MMAQEGHLAGTALLSGFEGIRNIDYDKPGSVYSTLFHLATGFERILKIVFILQYRFKHELAFPTNAELRNLGHQIQPLYGYCKVESEERSAINDWPASDSLQVKILDILNGFAKGSRYHNLDKMAGGSQGADPLVRWFEMHIKMAEDCLSYPRLEAVMNRARSHCDKHGLFGWEMGPLGRYELTVDVTYQLEVALLTTGHLVWAILELIKPVYRVLDQLVSEVQAMESTRGIETTVPYMTEFFPFGLTTRKDALRRKQWTKLFQMAGRV